MRAAATELTPKPGPKAPVQRGQAWSFSGAVEHQELVTEGQVFQEQVAAAIEGRQGEAKEQDQPADHAAEDAQNPLRIRVFPFRMELLPGTGVHPEFTVNSSSWG